MSYSTLYSAMLFSYVLGCDVPCIVSDVVLYCVVLCCLLGCHMNGDVHWCVLHSDELCSLS